MNFCETCPECSPPSIVLNKTIKVTVHHSRLRNMMGQSYPIYACTRANHAHYIIHRFLLNFAVPRNILY